MISSVLFFWLLTQTSFAATISGCAKWNDEDYARDFNHSKAMMGLSKTSTWISADLRYDEESPDVPEIHRHYHWDRDPACRDRVVQDGVISVRAAALRLVRSLAEFRGCTPDETETLLKKLSKTNPSSVKKPESAPEDALRLVWASDFLKANSGQVMVLEEEPSRSGDIYSQVLIQEGGKTRRVNVRFPKPGTFCREISNLESEIRKLLPLGGRGR
jgi:hypothetical protein